MVLGVNLGNHTKKKKNQQNSTSLWSRSIVIKAEQSSVKVSYVLNQRKKLFGCINEMRIRKE